MWVTAKLLFEYGIEDSVILSNKLYEPFRPHNFETAREKDLFVLEIIRVVLNILIAGISFSVQIYKMKQIKKLTSNGLWVATFELVIMIVFIVQMILMTQNTATAELLTDENPDVNSIYRT